MTCDQERAPLVPWPLPQSNTEKTLEKTQDIKRTTSTNHDVQPDTLRHTHIKNERFTPSEEENLQWLYRVINPGKITKRYKKKGCYATQTDSTIFEGESSKTSPGVGTKKNEYTTQVELSESETRKNPNQQGKLPITPTRLANNKHYSFCIYSGRVGNGDMWDCNCAEIEKDQKEIEEMFINSRDTKTEEKYQKKAGNIHVYTDAMSTKKKYECKTDDLPPLPVEVWIEILRSCNVRSLEAMIRTCHLYKNIIRDTADLRNRIHFHYYPIHHLAKRKYTYLTTQLPYQIYSSKEIQHTLTWYKKYHDQPNSSWIYEYLGLKPISRERSRQMVKEAKDAH